MIDFNNFPTFTESDFNYRLSQYTPIETHGGFLVKRDDYFNLGGIRGGKVRQCMKLVYDNLDHIKQMCNGGIITAAGLPSPQSCITSAVAKYFGLDCIVTVPRYNNTLYDVNRINVSLSQKLGAKVYGVGNPNPSGPESDAKHLIAETGYYQIKFGINGSRVMKTVSEQVKNIPESVDTIVIIAGSGLSALGVALGCKKYNKKNIKTIYAISLSKYIQYDSKYL